MSSRRQDYAPVFAALGDKMRLSLMAKLCSHSPQSISQLTHGSKVSRQAITKHLRAMENAGLVHNVRIGRQSFFEFKPKPIKEVREYLERISGQWEDALTRLKKFVED